MLRCYWLSAVLVAGAAFGASEIEQARTRLNAAPKDDNAASANVLMALLNEATAKAQATQNIPPKRGWEMLACDIQEALSKLQSAEAQKAVANALPRSNPLAQVCACSALKGTPANEDLDAVALKLLTANANFRLQVALIDLLMAHKYIGATEKILPLLDPKLPPPVQVMACRALALLPDGKSVPALMKYVEKLPSAGSGGRFLYEATGALRALTGEKLAPQAAELKRWWEKIAKDYSFDPTKVTEPQCNFELSEKADVYYYEIPVIENRLVIVLDTSGSMLLGGSPNRLDKAKEELTVLINRMNDKQLFNIVTFSSNIRRWKKSPGLVPATAANKKDAIEFLKALKPLGATQTMMTLEETLDELAVAFGCESIFLVTDGNPSPWALEITPAIQERRLTWLNQGLKVRFNTIGIYTSAPSDAKYNVKEDLQGMKEFLKKLAENNDGVYKEVGAEGAGK